jgi:chemotaxis protein CheD
VESATISDMSDRPFIRGLREPLQIMTKITGVADCLVSVNPAHSIATYALGSCIAVAVHDPVAIVGGLLHFLLPYSTLDPDRARENPFVYGDSGVPELVRRCLDAGARRRRLVVRAAGGATVLDKHGFFDVGRKNYLSLQKALWKSGLALDAERIGGVVARSLRLDVGSGELWIKEDDQTDWRSFPVRNENAGQENVHVAAYSRTHR